MLTKHKLHQCKECNEKITNVMQLLKHTAKHHGDDQSKTEDIKLEEQANRVLKEKDPLKELEAELSSLKKRTMLNLN